MKQIKRMATSIVVSTMLFSCGGSEEEVITINPEATAITGDLDGSIEVKSGSYSPVIDKSWGSLSLAIKVNIVEKFTEEQLKNKEIKLIGNILDKNGVPISGSPDLIYNDRYSNSILKALLKGNGNIIVKLNGSNIMDKEWVIRVTNESLFSISSSLEDKEPEKETVKNSDLDKINEMNDKNYERLKELSEDSDFDKDMEDAEKMLEMSEKALGLSGEALKLLK